MRAFLGNATLFHHNDPVHMSDGAESVSNGKHGLALHNLDQRLLDLGFNLAVERRGRLIQHKDRRVL